MQPKEADIHPAGGINGSNPHHTGPTQGSKPAAAKAELLSLAGRQVLGWSRHPNVWSAEMRNGSSWPVGLGRQRLLRSIQVRRIWILLTGRFGETRLAGLGRVPPSQLTKAAAQAA